MKANITTKAGFPCTTASLSIGDMSLILQQNRMTIIDIRSSTTQTAVFDSETDALECFRAALDPDCGQAFRDIFLTFAS